MYRITKLEDGLTVATAEMPHMTSASVGVWVGVGSRCEPPELNGACHFLEHLLFKGTSRRNAREISEAIEGIGGSLNAFTSEEVTCFHARACADRFEQLLEVLLDMVCHSLLRSADVCKEREVIKEEISMYLDEPQHLVQELLNQTLWPNQPLGRPITGTGCSLDRMRQVDLVNYLRRNYVTGSVIIVAAGNIRHGHHLRVARRLARSLGRGRRPEFLPALDQQTEPRLRLETRDTEQTQLALGIRTCSRHDARRYALRLLNTLLGENMSSRLFQIVREDHGMAYSIYSTPSYFADTGDLVISAGVDADKLAKTLHLILRELEKLKQSPPRRSELNRARDYVLGQIELSRENTESQMNWLGEQLLGYGRSFPPEYLRRQLRAVTPSQIQAVARDFLRPERLNLALVSPLKSTRSLRGWHTF